MGHYASELPMTSFEQQEAMRFNRMMALKEQIGTMSLGSFKVEDLFPIVKIYQLGGSLNEHELAQLEVRVAKIRKQTADEL